MIIIALIGVYLAKSGQLDNYEFFRMFKEQVESQKALQEAAKAVKDSINGDTMQHVIQTVKDSIR
jgi:hypothetical protein